MPLSNLSFADWANLYRGQEPRTENPRNPSSPTAVIVLPSTSPYGASMQNKWILAVFLDSTGFYASTDCQCPSNRACQGLGPGIVCTEQRDLSQLGQMQGACQSLNISLPPRDTDNDGTPDYRDPNYPLTCPTNCLDCHRQSSGEIACLRCKHNFNLANGGCTSGPLCSTAHCSSCGRCPIRSDSATYAVCHRFEDCTNENLCGRFPKPYSRVNWQGPCCDTDADCACDPNSFVHLVYDDGICRACKEGYELNRSNMLWRRRW